MSSRILLTFILLASPMLQAGAVVAQQSPPSAVLLLKRARIFDGKSAELSEPKTVHIVGNMIQRIASEIPTPVNAEVIDG